MHLCVPADGSYAHSHRYIFPITQSLQIRAGSSVSDRFPCRTGSRNSVSDFRHTVLCLRLRRHGQSDRIRRRLGAEWGRVKHPYCPSKNFHLILFFVQGLGCQSPLPSQALWRSGPMKIIRVNHKIIQVMLLSIIEVDRSLVRRPQTVSSESAAKATDLN